MDERAGWFPATEEEVASAAAAGLLDESTGRVELKRELGSGKKANVELARDLASLAVEGGLLLVGVDEPTGGAPARLHGVPLDGLPERVEQVALMRCDPPLTVRSVCIPSVDDPSRGYLAVRVPMSVDAPHMVDGRYWGRGVTTKRMLSDRDVEQLLARRRRLNETADEALSSFVERDPLAEAAPDSRGHMFLVAVPIGARPELLLDVIGTAGWQRTLLETVLRVPWPGYSRKFSPEVANAPQAATIPGGWMLSTHYGEELPRDPEGVLQVEIGEEGTIRVFCARATGTLRREAGHQHLFELLIAGVTLQTVMLAAHLGELTGFGGRWALGVELTGIADAPSWFASRRFLSQGRSYRDDRYRRLTSADTVEMASRPNAVTERLVGSLMRTMDVRDAPEIAAILDGPPPTTEHQP